MVRNTRTTEDGFVGNRSLVRLAWTEWSIHHLEMGGKRKWVREAERAMIDRSGVRLGGSSQPRGTWKVEREFGLSPLS